jgi:diaminohydroxyphosphoribosylaminopyrimidine deaminase/5-amino-6-(5-phosphoribosylamino)uracil reductase
MYSEADPRFMQRALELGEHALDATPNPRVGCLIVRDDQVLGEGYTQRPGSHHAEIEALNEARRRGHDVSGATVYVTLEPCSHFGRTPPCATALIEARVGRVVVAVEDPNPQVAGRGMELLRNAGVDVRCGLLRQEAVDANVGFFSRMTRGRPWVRLKLAASLDGRSALDNGVSRWITGEAARADGHAWRARACAILTGIGTVRADDPQLTVRLFSSGRQPLKVVADSRLAVDDAARLFDGNPVLVATARRDDAKAERLLRRQAQVAVLPGRDGRVDLEALLAELAARGVNELHVEAGATLSGALVRLGLADELLLYQAPVFLGPGRAMLELPRREDLQDLRHWQVRDLRLVGGDLRILARRDGATFPS